MIYFRGSFSQLEIQTLSALQPNFQTRPIYRAEQIRQPQQQQQMNRHHSALVLNDSVAAHNMRAVASRALLISWACCVGTHAQHNKPARIANLSTNTKNNAPLHQIPWRRNRLSRLFNPLGRIRDSANNRLAAFVNPSRQIQQIPSKKRQMYLTCFAIVFVWQSLGTLFYAYYYKWPIPQSFFYSVDAGMSIGFCTDVSESRVGSRAFTIIHILLGASCVGGALILMVQSVLDGVASRTSAVYKLILERDSLSKAFRGTQRGQYGSSALRHPLNWVPEKETGVLSYNDFRRVLYNNGLKQITDKEFLRICAFFDPHEEGCIRYDYFVERFEGMNRLIPQSRFVHIDSFLTKAWYATSSLFTNETNRIYLIFVLWVAMGVIWGIRSQHWDPITAMHVSTIVFIKRAFIFLSIALPK